MAGDDGDSAVGRLARWPALQDCARLPVRRLLGGRVSRVALRPAADDDRDPRRGLETVTRLLRRRDVEYYVYDLAPPESLVAVASTIAPPLERFSLVRLGMPVLPTGRGWATWTAARDGRTAGRAHGVTTGHPAVRVELHGPTGPHLNHPGGG